MWYVVEGALRGERPRDVVRRGTIIAIISFLTLIDLFGAQALLPQLVAHYQVEPSAMGFAVNASTFGMALSGLVVGWYADRIDRKRGIWISLMALTIPTFLLGFVDDLTTFAILRVLQGVFMAAAFTLSLTYLSEQCSITAAGGAMAAYITGNVASNLFGRIMAVSASDTFGLEGFFFFFAVLNIVGAIIALSLIGPKDIEKPVRGSSPLAAWKQHLSRKELCAAFGMGFSILFVFVGVFTYINFHLVDAFDLSPAQLGLVYLVFIPALFTTPMAGNAVKRFGPRPVFWSSALLAIGGIGLTTLDNLIFVLCGLAIIGSGTFFAQAAATGFVSKAAKGSKAAANGLYLTSYYVGGLVGSFLLGQVMNAGGWVMVASVVSFVLCVACLLAFALKEEKAEVSELSQTS